LHALARAHSCRHSGLSAYFGERLEACGDACDVCEREVGAGPRAAVSSSMHTQRSAAAERRVCQRRREADLDERGRGRMDALRAERLRIAGAAGLPPALVATDEELLAIAEGEADDGSGVASRRVCPRWREALEESVRLLE
jgi:ATP-dependent DNA helicase RecQ